MPKFDEPWDGEIEKPLAIAVDCPTVNGPSRIVMTTSLGRVLTFTQQGDQVRVWHDITPEVVRTTNPLNNKPVSR